MKVVTAGEMREIDRITIEEYGIPGEVLMFSAGKHVSDFISENYKGLKNIAVFCGTGNNGGDGFVISYLLCSRGFNVTIYLSGTAGMISETPAIYYGLCKKTDIDIFEVDGNDDTGRNITLDSIDLIVDALTGTGFKGVPRGTLGSLIDLINSANTYILSVDIPSGLPSNGEAPEGRSVKADVTVTIGLPKISLATYPGKSYAGRVITADIGFPGKLTKSEDIRVNLITNGYIQGIINRPAGIDAHKGDAGHLLLLGGFDGMEGAIMMAAAAALESGVGLISLATTENAREIIAGRIPELITSSLGPLASGSGVLPDEAMIRQSLDDVMGRYEFDAALIGPGMGKGVAAQRIFTLFMDRLQESAVKGILIDGDGLYHLPGYLEKYNSPIKKEILVTPHFREASRLLARDIGEIKKNRLSGALDLSRSIHAVALLKGPATIVTDGSSSYINTTGNPALATGGAGDVLSGIIGSFMLRSTVMEAACAGAYIHGRAADLFCAENSTDRMKATDIISMIRKSITEIQHSGS